MTLEAIVEAKKQKSKALLKSMAFFKFAFLVLQRAESRCDIVFTFSFLYSGLCFAASKGLTDIYKERNYAIVDYFSFNAFFLLFCPNG